MNEEILNLYRAYNVAMAADDVAALDKLLAPDFTLTHMTGYVQPRSEWLGELQRGTMRYFSSIEDHVEMTSEPKEWPLNTEMTVHQIAGQWQIMAAVVTTY